MLLSSRIEYRTLSCRFLKILGLLEAKTSLNTPILARAISVSRSARIAYSDLEFTAESVYKFTYFTISGNA